MRKAAVALVAVVVAMAGLVACQSADRNPLGIPVVEPAATDGGSARAAADPAPVPGGPVPVPLPGQGGSGGVTPIPVPGAPSKGGGGAPGAPGTPTPAPTPTPTPTPAALVTVTFTSTDVPKVSTVGPPPLIRSIIPVSGINGDVVDVRVAFKATIPNNSPLRTITVSNPDSAPDAPGKAALYDYTSQAPLTGSSLGTGCTPGGGATAFDDTLGTGGLSDGAPPYAGLFRSATAGPLTGLANFVNRPDYANGDWVLEFAFIAGGSGTLDCWSLTLVYRPL